jgi:hypothetical protein
VNLTGIDLRSGHHLRADLFYDGTVLAVTLTDTATGATAAVSFDVDIPAIVGGSTAFAGFTGSTGATVDRFASLNVTGWRFQMVPTGTPNELPAIARPARLVPQASYATEIANFQLRVEDDGGPFNLRYRWELLSAPAGASVIFDPAGQGTARFDLPGVYEFRVTVTDAQGQSATGEAIYQVE